jgi:hypothetical protein
MKKNTLLLTIIAAASLLVFVSPDARSQDTPTTTPAPAVRVPQPGQRPVMPPGFRTRAGGRYQQTIMFLKMSKAELEHATEDFDGHRQSAIDACDKALAELQAVQSSIQKAAAARAAAQQSQAPAAPNTTAAPAAPAAPATPAAPASPQQ